MSRLLAILALCILSFQGALYAAERPKIGVALEGGGAMGFAHVGVLKVLRESKVPIDFIAGTSMGAIVGAAYASGVSIEAMEKILTDTDWDELFRESAPREKIPFRYKVGREREIFGDVKIAFDETGVIIPSGAIQGQNIQPLFQRLYEKIPVPVRFDELPIPFRAVTADLETGEAIVPTKGDLSRIVRASMSVPGLFAPVEWEGRLLVDGGITNNLPVEIVREMGADIVIAVALPSKPRKREELSSPFAITGQILSFLLSQNASYQRSLLTEKDLLIEVDLEDFGPSDFSEATGIIALGEQSGEKYEDLLRPLSVSNELYARFEKGRVLESALNRTIQEILITPREGVSEVALRKALNIEPGDEFDRVRIETAIAELYNTGDYQEVRYDIQNTPDGVILTLHAPKKEWLKDYLRIGAAFEDDFEGDAVYRLAFNYRMRDVTSVGSYFDTIAEIGRSPNVSTELYQPLSDGSPYFIAPRLSLGSQRLFLRGNARIIAEYSRQTGSAQLAAGRALGSVGEFRFGMERGFGELDKEIGADTLPESSYDSGGAFSGVILDTADAVDFPTEGFIFSAFYNASLEKFGSSDDFHDVSFSLVKPVTFGRNTFAFSSDLVQTFDTRPAERALSLGGFIDLSGFERNSELASDLFVQRIIAYRNFAGEKLPFVGLDFFVGGSLEHATLGSDLAPIADPGEIWAGSIFLGVDTPLLPAYLAFGINDEDEKAVYLLLGRISRSLR